mmetsp:Transcript_17015/g.64878  ORF Transcript_17015/g.64878 Transcript_17015/m.64878 type:complete len:202 (+) Transcript_17015:823-1428(+)
MVMTEVVKSPLVHFDTHDCPRIPRVRTDNVGRGDDTYDPSGTTLIAGNLLVLRCAELLVGFEESLLQSYLQFLEIRLAASQRALVQGVGRLCSNVVEQLPRDPCRGVVSPVTVEDADEVMPGQLFIEVVLDRVRVLHLHAPTLHGSRCHHQYIPVAFDDLFELAALLLRLGLVEQMSHGRSSSFLFGAKSVSLPERRSQTA